MRTTKLTKNGRVVGFVQILYLCVQIIQSGSSLELESLVVAKSWAKVRCLPGTTEVCRAGISFSQIAGNQPFMAVSFRALVCGLFTSIVGSVGCGGGDM